MSKLYGRQIEILIDDEVVIERREGRQFKITFDVLVDFGSFNSYAELTLANLTGATVGKFKKDATLTIKAGYTNNVGVIFKGFIKNFFPDRNGATPITRIIARGSRAAVQREPVNVALGKNATLDSILQTIADAMGLPLVSNPGDFANVTPYPRGYTMTDDPERLLNKLAETHGFEWLVENERLFVLMKSSSRLGAPHLISQFTGMEGKPEITEVGANVTVRLDPKIKVGDVFRVESKYKSFNFSNVYFQDVPASAGSGDYKIQRLSYSGDTHGDAWSVKLTGIRKPA